MKRWAALPVLLLWAVAACAQISSFSIGMGPEGAAGAKGAPFTAETVTEITRVLQDGNHIHQELRGKVFRDSEGRTRSENAMLLPNAGEARWVTIVDPVKQVFITFGMQGEKTANVHHMNEAPAPTAPSPQLSTPPAKSQNQKDPADVQPCVASPAPEDLGTKVIDGFTVRGSRHTSTVEAGKIGNEKPIVSTAESWYSDELHEVLLSERDDPQSGHTISKLVNIQRGEPDPALFQVPPDYTAKDDSH
jgi:hypothetical protein